MTRPFIAAMLLAACTVASAQTSLQVLDYGAQPRSTIRYQFKPGQVDRATMEMVMDMSMEMNGEKMPAIPMPAIKATMEMRVVEVAADGSARVEFKMSSAEGSAGQATNQGSEALLNRTLAGLTQVSGSYRTDTRGRILDSRISMPDGFLPANAMQSLNDMMGQGSGGDLQQFPEEVVGVGARWTITQKHESGGMSFTLVQEYTLKSRAGNQIELQVKAGAPVITSTSESTRAVAAVNNQQTSSGTIRIDLQKLTPTMDIESASSSNATMPGPNGPSTMKSSSKMRMSLAPATE